MSKLKKKLNVIRPTLRHKKLYLKLEYTKEYSSNLYTLLLKNYEKINGLFSSLECNLTVMENDYTTKTMVVRLNKAYKESFLSSLFFLKQDLGLIFVLKEASTLNSLK